MTARKADGCDFFEVYATMREATAQCRAGSGPVAVEFDTERFFGHFEGDPQKYRGPGEVERLRRERDCLVNFRNKALEQDVLSAAQLDQADREVGELIETAVKEARAAAPPSPEQVLEDVYINY
jgi:pyruvate dehydrogenase E1 component alpha subunit